MILTAHEVNPQSEIIGINTIQIPSIDCICIFEFVRSLREYGPFRGIIANAIFKAPTSDVAFGGIDNPFDG